MNECLFGVKRLVIKASGHARMASKAKAKGNALRAARGARRLERLGAPRRREWAAGVAGAGGRARADVATPTPHSE